MDLQSFTVATYNYLNYVFALAYAIVLLQFGIGIRNLKSAASCLVWKTREKFVAKSSSKSTENVEPLKSTRDFLIIDRPPTANELLIYGLTALLLFLSLFGRGDYRVLLRGNYSTCASIIFFKRESNYLHCIQCGTHSTPSGSDSLDGYSIIDPDSSVTEHVGIGAGGK